EGVPRPVDLERAERLAVVGVAQVQCDAAVRVRELFQRIERRLRAARPASGQRRDRRVEAAARQDQQRKAGPGFLVMKADGTAFAERHYAPPLSFVPTLSGSDILIRGEAGCDRVRKCRLCGAGAFGVASPGPPLKTWSPTYERRARWVRERGVRAASHWSDHISAARQRCSKACCTPPTPFRAREPRTRATGSAMLRRKRAN